MRYHIWLTAAICIALAVTMGYLLAPVPNVELMSATLFISGALLGAPAGAGTGASAALIFSLLNPMGTAAPPLLLAQMSGMAIIGATGGLAAGLRAAGRRRSLLFGCIGITVTLLYDLLTTLSFAPFVAGGDPAAWLALFAAGAPFYLIHLSVNGMVFALLVPLVLDRVRRALNLSGRNGA